MKIRFVVALLAILTLSANVWAQSNEICQKLEEKVRAQEQRIQELEQKLEKMGMDSGKGSDYTKQLVKEYLNSPEVQEQMGTRAGYDNGFFIRAGDLEFKFTGFVKFNANFYEVDTASTNTFWAKDVRLQFHVYFYKNWHAVVDIETSGGAGDLLRDMFIEYHWSDALNFRAGQFIVPFSVEAQEPEWDLLTIYHSPIVAAAATYGAMGSLRDIGWMAYGNLFDYVSYALAMVNGNGRNAANDKDDFHYFVQLRIHPFTTEHERTFFHMAYMRGREGVRAEGADLATPWGWEVFDADGRVPANEVKDAGIVAGDMDATSGWTQAVSVGFSYVKDDSPLRAQGEFIWKELARNRGLTIVRPGTAVALERRASKINMYGFWLQFSYFIQITDDKHTGIEPLIKFSYADVDEESSDYPGSIGDVGLGNVFDIRGQDLWCYTLGFRAHLNKHIRADFNWVMAVPEHTDHIGLNAGSTLGSIADKVDHSGATMHALLFQLQAKW
jgi:hypothetical protein